MNKELADQGAGWGKRMLRLCQLGRSIIVALLLVPHSLQAHSWQDGLDDMLPDEVEAVVSRLETTLEAPQPEDWALPEEFGDGSFDLAIEFALATDQIGKIANSAERVLMTYDALRFGVIDAQGDVIGETDLDFWLEYLRPHDAPAVAPFVKRLDAWRANFETVPQ